MISNKERSKQREWTQTDRDFDRRLPIRCYHIDEKWVKVSEKYARSTKTGQIVNKKDGKMVKKLFLDSI